MGFSLSNKPLSQQLEMLITCYKLDFSPDGVQPLFQKLSGQIVCWISLPYELKASKKKLYQPKFVSSNPKNYPYKGHNTDL